MATYTEIDELLAFDEPTGLRRRIAVGAMVAADAIRQETDDPTDATVQQRKRFAQAILRSISNSELTLSRSDNAGLAFNPIYEAVYRSVLIANIGNTQAQITGASDAQIQTAVDNAVDMLALSYPDPATP